MNQFLNALLPFLIHRQTPVSLTLNITTNQTGIRTTINGSVRISGGWNKLFSLLKKRALEKELLSLLLPEGLLDYFEVVSMKLKEKQYFRKEHSP